MKMLLSFLILILSVSAFSQSLSGTTWTQSGVGCRDGSLDASTHISKLPTSSDVMAGVIYFVDGSNINMTATVQGTEKNHSGTYSVNGNEVTVTGASGGGSMTIEIVEGRLVIVGSRTESEKECCNLKFVEKNGGSIKNMLKVEEIRVHKAPGKNKKLKMVGMKIGWQVIKQNGNN